MKNIKTIILIAFLLSLVNGGIMLYTTFNIVNKRTCQWNDPCAYKTTEIEKSKCREHVNKINERADKSAEFIKVYKLPATLIAVACFVTSIATLVLAKKSKLKGKYMLMTVLTLLNSILSFLLAIS